MKTPQKSRKVFDFVEVALEHSKFANMTDNRKHRKKVTVHSRQERNNVLITTDIVSGHIEAVTEEHHCKYFNLSKKIANEDLIHFYLKVISP